MTRTLIISALVLAGCGESEPTPDGPATSNPATLPNASNSIVDVASGDPQFSTLVSALVDADLVDTLAGDGPFTVFAPTNEAFDDLGIDLSTLSGEQLTEILLYHVVAGAAVDSGSVPALADSASSYTLFFDTTSGVRVNNATVTAADVQADNGIIHVIDTVLLPPTIADAAGFAGLSALAGAVGAADPAVGTLLSSPGDYTVFAPTNEAFEAISETTASLEQGALTDVLTYHVFNGRVDSSSIPSFADSLLQNPYGNNVTAIFSTENGVFVNGSEVVIADVKTTNGIVHVVDSVLLPPTVVDHAVTADLTGLLDTVGAASGDLGTVLSGPGPFTVFAPDNDAFDAISSVAAGLTPETLEEILLFHVVGDAVASTELSNGEVPSLLTGETLTVDLSAGVRVEDATVVVADVHGTNGTVHIIDSVMLPPSM